ncbi:hypothetical protein BKA59DRAFT_469397 [Fusarium tricinctum]|uniref:Uncharacterized protein n=1 Tax=Fusarium tricinctum TaxID=61284 RepID=A0A8K0WGU9_9HYPO|nr:hypothetical protein BKA59DRAFT_469397 [Fusarium tricinctum]
MPTSLKFARAYPMPRRCAVLPCRSGMRPVLGSPEGIWVTNAMLARAIDRFHHVYPVPRRSLSGCPGPLESRRRMGKRHMTAIFPDSHASPLPWTFPWTIELPTSLGDWSWEAPVPRESRHKKTIGLVERFLRNLEGIKSENDVTPLQQTAAVTPVGQALLKLNKHLALLPELDDATVVFKACESYVLDILAMIAEKSISSDDLLLTLDPFDDNIRRRASAEVLDNVLSRQWIYIIHCIHDTRESGVRDIYGGEVWHQCLKTVFRMTPQPLVFDFMDELLRLTRLYPKITLEFNDYYDLMRSHLLLEASQSQQHPVPQPISTHLLRRNIYLSRMFVLENSTPIITYQQACQAWMETGKDDNERRTITFHMLLKLASTPGLDSKHFTILVNDIGATQGWAETEVWQFLALHLMRASRWKLPPEYLMRWLEMPTTLHSWAALITSAFHHQTRKRKVNFSTLLSASDVFGHLDTLMKAVRLMKNHRITVTQMIARERNPAFALTIWEAYNEGMETPDKLPWFIWVRHAEFLITDPAIPVGVIWRIAEFDPSKVAIKLRRAKKWDIVYSMDFLAVIGQLYLKKPDLTTRTRLRYIEQAINLGKASRQPMSQSLIQLYAGLQLKDLEMGNLGRRARLRYLVSKIEEFYGKDQAKKVAISLEGWTHSNKNRRTPRVPIKAQSVEKQEVEDEKEGESLEMEMKAQRREAKISTTGNTSF